MSVAQAEMAQPGVGYTRVSEAGTNHSQYDEGKATHVPPTCLQAHVICMSFPWCSARVPARYKRQVAASCVACATRINYAFATKQ